MGHLDKDQLEEELKNIKPGFISWMAAHPVAANLLMIILILGGFIILSKSKQEIFPEFELDMVTISMAYPGASPEEVEQGIILAVEDAVKDIEGIGEMSARAHENIGYVNVEIDTPSEAIRISQDIKTAVDQISTFPVDAEDLVVQLAQSQELVMNIVIFGNASEIALRNAAENLRDTLEQSPDISLVELSGVRGYEIHVEVPPESLRRYNLSVPEIANIISSTAIELGGGALKTASGEILVRMTERRDYADEFNNIPIIKNPNGSTLYLGDIAIIKETFEDKNIYARYNGKPAIELTIQTTATQTPTGIATATKAVIEKFEKTIPEAISVIITQDRSVMFQQRAQLLIKNGIVGLILVVIFLALFLDVRLAFWVAMGIPISYMGAFLFLPLADNFSINMVSMFAFIIALGIVVDDAVVVGENIFHKREMKLKPLEASVKGAREMATPVTISVLTNIIAFLPMFFMPGFMGKVFSIIPVIVISTFLLSLIESLFILPAHLTFSPSKNIQSKPLLSIIKVQKGFNRRFTNFVQNKYVPFLKKSVSLRYISLAVFLAVLIIMGAYVASGRLGIQMFPRVESDFSYAQATLKVGTAKQEVIRVEQKMIDAAQKVIDENGKEQLSTGIYSQVDENVIKIYTFLTDPDIRTLNTNKFTGLWREHTGPMPGLESLVFASDHGGPGSGAALTVELSHSDTKTLEKAAQELGAHLAEFPNTQDIDDGSAQGKRQFDFTMTDLGYTLGLTPAEVGRQVRGGFYGSEALKQQRGRNEVRVLVLLPKDVRSSSYDFMNSMIKAPNGTNVMLRDVVQVAEGQAYTTINRRDSRRVITVEADVTPPSETNRIIATIKSDIIPKLQARYPGLTYSFEGQQADMRESLQSLFIGMFAVLFVMYAILAVLFSSYSQPFMILIAIPFSMVGAIIGHFIMGFPMSIVSMFGIIALAGVVINDSLILIDLANKKRKESPDNFTAVVNAASQRFRPIILTTLTTFVGLAPMMFETSRQARFLIPMAISLGYGIVFATFLTLFLIPSLYMINEDLKKIAVKLKSHL